MPEALVLILAASGTALATGLGAVPVFLLGRRASALAGPLLGFSAGAMTVAAFTGLLVPAAEEGSAAEVAAGLLVGVAFVLLARRLLPPDHGFLGRRGPDASASALVFLVLFVHSLPETAVATSAPQPVGAVVSWLAVEAIGGLLPFSFAFAAGAMLTIVAIEVAPRALADGVGRVLLGALAGGVLLGALSLALGV